MPVDTSGDPPKGYITVRDALDRPIGELVNIIGVVVDIGEPTKCKGSDMLLTFRIRDNSVPATTAGLKARRFFSQNSRDQPHIHHGDLVVLRAFKLIAQRFGRVALFSYRSDLVVFPASKLPEPHFNDEYASGMKLLAHESTSRDWPPTSAEQIYAISLHHACRQNDGQQAHDNSRRIIHAAPTAPMISAKDKFRLLSDCEENKFYDLAVEVVKKFPRDGRCEIYATDYTENARFYDYGKERGGVDGDPFNFTEPGFGNGWKGPHGKRTIQIMLYEPHASHCVHKISEKDLVFIRNVRIKADRDGWKLEGALHQDRVYTDRVDIIKPNLHDGRMSALQSRRDRYWNNFGSADQDARKQKRKGKKKAKQRAQREQEDSESDGGCNSYVVTLRTQPSPTRLADMLDNAHYNFKTSTGVAYKLPFINAIFRTQVRVVDYHPRDLADFSRSLADPSYGDGSSGWEWAFYLLVEDAKQTERDAVRVPLLVADQDAEHLLDFSATDLRRDGAALEQLRNKLFVLWGNLEELKAETGEEADVFADEVRKRHQSAPFECLVKQYGVEVPYEEGDAGLGFQRMFRLFGTTIK